MSLRILPALAALAAAIAKPFRRKKKPRTLLQTLQPKNVEPKKRVSLYGVGKAAAELRHRRRRVIFASFSRFLARKPMGDAAVGPRGAAWRAELEQWRAIWTAGAKESRTVYLGRRAQKARARRARDKKVRGLKKLKRLQRIDAIALALALGACMVGQ